MNTPTLSKTTLSIHASHAVIGGLIELFRDFQIAMARPKGKGNMANAWFWLGRICGEAEYLGWKFDVPATEPALCPNVELPMRYCVREFNDAIGYGFVEDEKMFLKRCKECRTTALDVERQLVGMKDGIQFAMYHKPTEVDTEG